MFIQVVLGWVRNYRILIQNMYNCVWSTKVEGSLMNSITASSSEVKPWFGIAIYIGCGPLPRMSRKPPDLLHLLVRGSLQTSLSSFFAVSGRGVTPNIYMFFLNKNAANPIRQFWRSRCWDCWILLASMYVRNFMQLRQKRKFREVTLNHRNLRVRPPMPPTPEKALVGDFLRDDDGLHKPLIRPAISWGETWHCGVPWSPMIEACGDWCLPCLPTRNWSKLTWVAVPPKPLFDFNKPL